MYRIRSCWNQCKQLKVQKREFSSFILLRANSFLQNTQSRELLPTNNNSLGGLGLTSRRFCATTVEMDKEVVHDEQNKMFYIKLDDGGKALLEYEQVQDGVLDFYHTEVPTNQRGKGIAQHLVKGSLAYAFGNDFKVKPSCSYVAKYVNEKCDGAEKDKIVT